MISEGKILILTPCTKNKRVDVSLGNRIVQPAGYLADEKLVAVQRSCRETVWRDFRSQYDPASNLAYPFDMYVRHESTQLYRDLRGDGLAETIRDQMVSAPDQFPAEWFFLSGGYGLLHSLEPARKYQASFSYQIANQANPKIPCTRSTWKTLPAILDSLFSTLKPRIIHVFGPPDYTQFVERTVLYRENRIRFEMNVERSSGAGIRSRLLALAKTLLKVS